MLLQYREVSVTTKKTAPYIEVQFLRFSTQRLCTPPLGKVVEVMGEKAVGSGNSGTRGNADPNGPKPSWGPCVTLTTPLSGAEGWHRGLSRQLIQDHRISSTVSDHLVQVTLKLVSRRSLGHATSQTPQTRKAAPKLV